ncbi:MAG: maltose alpha-D-glucosyltransferase, partial [Candidatus Competibacterales bacterium]
WYQDAIIYQLHVKAYLDSNGDGIGDFKGLTRCLDYIQDLGVNTLWLLPFYPSPLRDDGYDIADYKNVHPDYGSRADFRAFVKEAHRRGLKVITELVINHTSDQHAWFQAARHAPKASPKRQFYVWSDTDQALANTRIIFTDTETSNWAWDPVAKQYYWHRFFSHQPDLNHNNPQVVRAVTRIMRFWLDQGVDGLRLDAIPYLCVREGTNNENLPETHEAIRQIRAAVDGHYQHRMLLAEANQWPEDVREYFGEGDECHMAYHFPLMPRMYMALAQEDRHPIVEIMEQTPTIPPGCQWAIFLRNHDELTLEMVTDKERDYMYNVYAADPRMRVNVGIRRRLAPLLDNDLDKIKLMNNLLLSMPGSPIIYYGDEIGMGDNIYLGDRNGVRTPMQWSFDRNAGFSKADPQRLYLPPIMDPIYGYEAVNVEAQSREPSSLLNWMKRLIAVRKGHRAFGRGTLRFIRPGNRKILAFIREYRDDVILCVSNLSRYAQPVELNLAEFQGRVPVELLGHTPFPPIGELPYLLTLPGYGFYWFRLGVDEDIPAWHEEHLPPQELPVLVLFQGWDSFFPERIAGNRATMALALRRQFERDVLPAYLRNQRWYAAKGAVVEQVEVEHWDRWQDGQREWLLFQCRVTLQNGPSQRYFVPLGLALEGQDDDRIRATGWATLAKVRRQAQVGMLYDAFADEQFSLAVVRAMAQGLEVRLLRGTVQFVATEAFDDLVGRDLSALSVRRLTAESSNTAVVVGERAFLKGYRRLQVGVNPELELGRFLTEAKPMATIARLGGYVAFTADDGQVTTLGLLQEFKANQGDAWQYSVDYLKRSLNDDALRGVDSPWPATEHHSVHLLLMDTLGRRTGELHCALGTPTGDPAFDPIPVTAAMTDAWVNQILDEAQASFELLERARGGLEVDAKACADRLLALRPRLPERLAELPLGQLQAMATRHHGDYHLGQVLVARNDFIIIDFEGEPTRTLEERRAKHSPLKDVAGMLRSFYYAAFAALLDVTQDRPDDYHRLSPFAAAWEQVTADAFLTGYFEAAAASPGLPADANQAKALIQLFTLEKAFYELRYELNNRPHWVIVPLLGVLALLN